MIMTLKLKNGGDTLVEVLVALGVISVVLAGAYTLTSRNVNTIRQAQERGEALKLIEGQLERLKDHSPTAADPMYTLATPFCIDSTNTIINPISAACTMTPQGGNSYNLSITRTAPNRFSVQAVWDRAGGGTTQEQARIIYRLYP